MENCTVQCPNCGANNTSTSYRNYYDNTIVVNPVKCANCGKTCDVGPFKRGWFWW